MEKHTPGPWEVEKNRNGSHDIIHNTSGWKFSIAETVGGFTNGSEEANAKLIASAPDLLKFLQQLVDLYDITGAITMIGGTPHIIKAKAAIKKATS